METDRLQKKTQLVLSTLPVSEACGFSCRVKLIVTSDPPAAAVTLTTLQSHGNQKCVQDILLH